MTDQQIYDRLAKVLKDIHERFPEDAFTKYQRLRGLLSDHLPDAEREIRITLDAIDEGVIGVLSDTPTSELAMQIDRLVLRLETSRGIREDIARLVVQSFAYALDVGTLPSATPTRSNPITPPPAEEGADDWVGVSEAVQPESPGPGPSPDPGPSVSGSAESPRPPPAGDKTDPFAKIPGGRNGLMIGAAAVVVGALLLGEGDEPPTGNTQPTGGNPATGGDPGQGPGRAPTGSQPAGGQPLIEPGATDGLPRVGPGSGTPGQQPSQPPGRQPGAQVPGPQVGPGTQGPRGQPGPQGGGAGTALWYDDYGNVWNIQYTQSEFQGTSTFNGQQVMIQGQGDPTTNQIVYMLGDAFGNPFGQGQGYFTDPQHIEFMTMDAMGNIIGQGKFHINHPPDG
ncbi:MAG: hypothetical protein AAGI15_03935 [Pseudomonadota bacterium]